MSQGHLVSNSVTCTHGLKSLETQHILTKPIRTKPNHYTHQYKPYQYKSYQFKVNQYKANAFLCNLNKQLKTGHYNTNCFSTIITNCNTNYKTKYNIDHITITFELKLTFELKFTFELNSILNKFRF